jgi:hypothetical protein
MFVVMLAIVVFALRQEDEQHEMPRPAAVLPDPYAAYIARHADKARVVKRGEPFMLDDKTPLIMSEQLVYYQGLDEYDDIVYRYDLAATFGGRTVTQPVILPAQVELVDGTPRPRGTVVGDAQIGKYLLRIVSATQDECRYVVEQ